MSRLRWISDVGVAPAGIGLSVPHVRIREEGDSPHQSEAKHSRQEQEGQEEVWEVERSARQPPAPSAPEPSVCTPASNGEGGRLGQDSDAGLHHSPEPSSHRPAVGKRKEIPMSEVTEGCSSEVDMEELELIMSTPMDEDDQQDAPSKRARLDPVRDIKEEGQCFVEVRWQLSTPLKGSQ